MSRSDHSNDRKFDPYRKWLGVTSKRRPPTHYDLLGIDPREDDLDVIEAAATRRYEFVRSQLGAGQDRAANGVMLQIKEAEAILTNPKDRVAYDRTLKLKRRKKKAAAAVAPGGVLSDGMYGGLPPRTLDRSGASVGEGSDFLRTYVGIVAVLGIAFAAMLAWSFAQPWERLAGGFDPQDNAAEVAADLEAGDAAQPAGLDGEVAAAASDSSGAVASGGNGAPWEPLFNGRDKSNWSGSQNWVVENGLLIGRTTNAIQHFLWYDSPYEDYELRVMFDDLQGNSGVQVRSVELPGKLMKGPHVEIDDLELRNGDTAFFGSVFDQGGKRGWIAEADAATRERVRRTMNGRAFHELLIRVEGERVQTTVNGVPVCDTVIESKGSLIALQSHAILDQRRGEVAFREIEIRPIGRSAPDTVDAATTAATEIDQNAIDFDSISTIEWTPLWNGRNFDGWTVYDRNAWKIENGAIVGRTDDKYKRISRKIPLDDYELKLRVWFVSGNGGLSVRCEDPGRFPFPGIEVEIDNSGNWGRGGRRITGHLYLDGQGSGFVGTARNTVQTEVLRSLRANPYSELRVRVEGKRYTTRVNGILVVDRAMKNVPQGPVIALLLTPMDGERGFVHFKDIAIRRVSPEAFHERS